ncbi:hypothetical protein BT93_L4151 [Corymbia citriodora subsp. variegata]|uniref:F-box domain-containing protein n=1 Tax=Corymbia citriodora subsp. variegata TaxID=360336 RepID=A0A8T0CUJ5_CORYI|nr:hypothetical protein BT93_L4151 [Corymbia citriodora subsp. variegata]
MAETSVHGAAGSELSDDRWDRAKQPLPPAPPSPGDLISTLPDAVIHRIFSFLPVQSVVKTSVLSKRWRSIWTSTAGLIFHDVLEEELPWYTSDFLSLVDSVLLQSISPAVRRFHIVDFVREEASCPKLDSWLRFTAVHHVEDLRDNSIRWPCLKFLLIGGAKLSDDILEEIVRGSPVLESLGVVRHDSVFRLDGVSSLVEAKLDFVVPAGNWMCCNLLKELFEQLLGVPTITIGSRCLQFESHEESKEHFNFEREDFLCSWKGNFECLAKHLKRVEIIGFEADSFWSNHLLALIKFIIGDALLLEKLIIKAKLPTRHV